jgi:hypothetical protein
VGKLTLTLIRRHTSEELADASMALPSLEDTGKRHTTTMRRGAGLCPSRIHFPEYILCATQKVRQRHVELARLEHHREPLTDQA